MKLLAGLALFFGSGIFTYKLTFNYDIALGVGFFAWFIYWLIITLYFDW